MGGGDVVGCCVTAFPKAAARMVLQKKNLEGKVLIGAELPLESLPPGECICGRKTTTCLYMSKWSIGYVGVSDEQRQRMEHMGQ